MRKPFKIFYPIIILSMIMLFALSCSLHPTLTDAENHGTTTAPSPTIASSTAITTKTKTPFPANTLTAPEREKFVQKSLSGSSNCKLPCWWGIMPGETTWVETEELLNYLGVRIGTVPAGYTPNAIFHGTGGFDFDGLSIINRFSFEETNGIIDAILIHSDGYDKPQEFQALWRNYSPKKTLKEYGVPDRIWLNVTQPYNFGRGYFLWFFYDKLGFMIRYPGDILDAPVLQICPRIEGMVAIDLSLQAPNMLLPLERFDALLEDIRLQTETGKTRELHSIQDATGLNEEDFYDLFMQEEELICFDTPSNIWDIK